MNDQTPSIGHNDPPLEDRIFQEPGATIATVLASVESRILREHEDAIAVMEKRAEALSENSSRLPKTLEGEDLDKALDLLSDMAAHSAGATEEKDSVIQDAKSTYDALTKRCKNLEAGLAALEKKLRPLVEDALIARLHEENEQLPEGEKPYATYTHRAQSGAKATITMAPTASISDESAIPREYLVPDMKAIEKDFAAGKDIPGILSIDKAAMRLYKSG